MISTTKRIIAATYCATINALMVATTATCIGFVGIFAAPLIFVVSFSDVIARTSAKGIK